MSLDEALFGRLHGWLRRKLRPPDAARAARRVELEPLQKRLGIVASLLAGWQIEVRPTGGQGSLGGDRLLLPAAIDWAPSAADNLDAYLLRTALAVAAPDATLAADVDAGALDDDARALATLRAAPGIVAQARRRWPGFGSLFDRLAALRQQLATLRQQLATLRQQLATLRQQMALRRQLVPAPADVAHRALAALERVQLGADPMATAADLPLLARPWLLRAVREPHGDFDACLHEWQRLPRRRRAAPFDLSFWGDLGPSRAAPSPSTTAPPPAALPPAALPTGTERAAPAPNRVEVVELPDPEGDNPLAHVFEKVRTAEEHQGGNRQLDGSDELQQHLDAIQQLDLRRLVRSRVPTASVYRADLWLDGGPVDVADVGGSAPSFCYDEWDDGARAYRRGWCRLFVDRPPAIPAAAAATALRAVRSRHARAIRRLRAELERLERRRALQRRQLHGTDVDVDAVIDRHAALRATRHGGCVDDQRLYTASRPAHHDLATLLLLDQSLSTDSWVDNRRVLDVARDSVAVLGEVLRDARMRTAVAAFSSNARRDCRFQLVKGFDDPWRSAHARLFGLRPTGYTRIGPAIRHAAHLLTASGCRRRVLLIVSDGKPTDYDRYEGRYGIADVRQAVREARQRGITTIALAIDRRAKEHLPRMFGEHGYRLLRHPRDLPQALARLHEHLLR